MKKFFLMIFLLAGLAFGSYAQSEGHASIALDAGIPAGASGDAYNYAIGGSLKFESPTSEKAFFTISLGYASLSTKEVLIDGSTLKPPAAIFAPVKLGLKYQLAGVLYAEGQIGAAFETRGRRSTRFIYAPGLVCSFERIDLGVRYEGWAGSSGNISQAALRLGYRF